ncbi:MAG: protein kinase [archaeon]|nr:protein kinase [archaeon]
MLNPQQQGSKKKINYCPFIQLKPKTPALPDPTPPEKNIFPQNSQFTSKYKILNELGRGAFSTVYKVQSFRNNNIYCVKRINLPTNSAKDDLMKTETELEILKKISNENNRHIIQYYDHYTENGYMYIIMEYCEFGDLYSLLHSVKKHHLYIQEDILWDISYQCLLALDFLHSHHIIHRDIKLLNIFMSKDKTVKIGDLGMGKLVEEDAMNFSRVGTPLFLAPEMVKKERYDYKVDIWSLGCSLYHLAKLVPPFNEENLILLGQAIVKDTPADLPDIYSEEFKKLIFKLLEKDKNKRCTAKEAINKYVPERIKKKYEEKIKKKTNNTQEEKKVENNIGNDNKIKDKSNTKDEDNSNKNKDNIKSSEDNKNKTNNNPESEINIPLPKRLDSNKLKSLNPPQDTSINKSDVDIIKKESTNNDFKTLNQSHHKGELSGDIKKDDSKKDFLDHKTAYNENFKFGSDPQMNPKKTFFNSSRINFMRRENNVRQIPNYFAIRSKITSEEKGKPKETKKLIGFKNMFRTGGIGINHTLIKFKSNKMSIDCSSRPNEKEGENINIINKNKIEGNYKTPNEIFAKYNMNTNFNGFKKPSSQRIKMSYEFHNKNNFK